MNTPEVIWFDANGDVIPQPPTFAPGDVLMVMNPYHRPYGEKFVVTFIEYVDTYTGHFHADYQGRTWTIPRYWEVEPV